MGDNITLNNGLTLGGMFQEKEKIIQQLQQENSQLRRDKAQLKAENQTVLQEQAQTIAHLNQQLRLLTSEQTKHCSTVQILETVKMEKNFLEEDSKLQEEERRKQKERICQLEKSIAHHIDENSKLAANLAKETLTVQEERKENYTLSCLIGERDVTIEQCRSELSRVNKELGTLKHALASKDTKLKAVLEERNKAQWKLQDYLKTNVKPKPRSNSSSNIPVTPPRTPRKSASGSSAPSSVSPTTVTALHSPENEEQNDDELSESVSQKPPSILMEDKASSFDLKEKHYLSLIFRLRTELAKFKESKEEGADHRTRENKSDSRRLPLKSNFVRKSSNMLKR